MLPPRQENTELKLNGRVIAFPNPNQDRIDAAQVFIDALRADMTEEKKKKGKRFCESWQRHLMYLRHRRFNAKPQTLLLECTGNFYALRSNTWQKNCLDKQINTPHE